jgi:hypothetical protein
MANLQWKPLLEEKKKEKIQELDETCNRAIVSGFNHTINGVEYHFSFDIEAQLNFQGAERILSNELVPEVMWTVSRNGEYERIPITKAIMSELTMVILQHKDSNYSKFRDVLMKQVENATTVEEIQAITWE